MARFKHLEIYQQAYKLCREFHRVKIKLPKNLKYNLGDDVSKSALKIIKGIVIANGSSDKLKALQVISLEIEVLWVFFRMLFDFQGISRGEFQVFSEMLTDLSKQNQNWIKWAMAKKNNI